MADIYLNNKMSAKEICLLVQKANAAGIQEVEGMVKAGSHGRWKNAARNLTRELLKNTDFPEPYWAEIPVWDRSSQTQKLESLPFLLSFDVLFQFVTKYPTFYTELAK